jgi:hypothetical protein
MAIEGGRRCSARWNSQLPVLIEGIRVRLLVSMACSARLQFERRWQQLIMHTRTRGPPMGPPMGRPRLTCSVVHHGTEDLDEGIQKLVASPDVQEHAPEDLAELAGAMAGQAERAALEDLRKRCERFGMCADAIDGWSQTHDDPVTAMKLFFVSELIVLLCVLSIFSAVPWRQHMQSVLYLMVITLTTCYIGAAWRMGPRFGGTCGLYTSLVVFVVAATLPTFIGFLGPYKLVPFGSKIIYTMVTALQLWAQVIALQNGLLNIACPHPPRTAVLPVIFNSAVTNVRLIDAVTDMALIGVLLHEVGPGQLSPTAPCGGIQGARTGGIVVRSHQDVSAALEAGPAIKPLSSACWYTDTDRGCRGMMAASGLDEMGSAPQSCSSSAYS